MFRDFERADAIGSHWATRTFPELLIDCEEDRTLRAVLVGMLPEADRQRRGPEAGTDSAREGSGRSMMTWRTRKIQVGCRPSEDSGGS